MPYQIFNQTDTISCIVFHFFKASDLHEGLRDIAWIQIERSQGLFPHVDKFLSGHVHGICGRIGEIIMPDGGFL